MRGRIKRELVAQALPSVVRTRDQRIAETFKLLGRIEQESRHLRAVPTISRRYRLHDSVAVAEASADAASRAAEQPERELRGAPGARADVVHFGRGDAILRLRAFYPSAGLTVVAHGRLLKPWPWEAALHRGAKVCELVRGIGDLVVPRIAERGRGLRHAWVVEEHIRGRVPSSETWQYTVPLLLDGLASIWTAEDAQERPMSHVLSRGAAAEAVRVLEHSHPPGRDGREMAASVRRLVARTADRRFFVGLCHGDPARWNVLELPDGRLALTDWEAAGRAAFARDAEKALVEIDDPLPVIEQVANRLQPLGTQLAASWRDQITAASLARLARYPARLRKVALIRDPRLRRAVATNHEKHLQLLVRILDE